MLVRLNIGRKAGEVQDIEPSAARRMIADGRASEVVYESGESKPEGVAQLAHQTAAEPSAEPQSTAKKKR
jgi:hypothetical protein